MQRIVAFTAFLFFLILTSCGEAANHETRKTVDSLEDKNVKLLPNDSDRYGMPVQPVDTNGYNMPVINPDSPHVEAK